MGKRRQGLDTDLWHPLRTGGRVEFSSDDEMDGLRSLLSAMGTPLECRCCRLIECDGPAGGWVRRRRGRGFRRRRRRGVAVWTRGGGGVRRRAGVSAGPVGGHAQPQQPRQPRRLPALRPGYWLRGGVSPQGLPAGGAGYFIENK
eukprot:1176272-Prorocentrum_minimum.AAC.8